MLGDETIAVSSGGFVAALEWGCGRGPERVWALEDCRHVSGAFERFLLEHGERVVRVATKLMAGERRGARHRGKSDLIDALAVARAALAERRRGVLSASWVRSGGGAGEAVAACT